KARLRGFWLSQPILDGLDALLLVLGIAAEQRRHALQRIALGCTGAVDQDAVLLARVVAQAAAHHLLEERPALRRSAKHYAIYNRDIGALSEHSTVDHRLDATTTEIRNDIFPLRSRRLTVHGLG